MSVRFEKLEQIADRSVDETAKHIESIHTCFPKLVEKERGRRALTQAQRQVEDYFKRTCKKQYKLIYEERKLEQKLEELEEIISRAQDRMDGKLTDGNPVFIESLSPHQLSSIYLYSAKKETLEHLEEQLEKETLVVKSLEKDLEDIVSQFMDEHKEIDDGSLASLLEATRSLPSRDSVEKVFVDALTMEQVPVKRSR